MSVTLKDDPTKKVGKIWGGPPAVLGSKDSPGIFPLEIPNLVWVKWPDRSISGERVGDLSKFLG